MIKEQSDAEANLTCVLLMGLVNIGIFNDQTQHSCYEIKGLGLLM